MASSSSSQWATRAGPVPGHLSTLAAAATAETERHPPLHSSIGTTRPPSVALPLRPKHPPPGLLGSQPESSPRVYGSFASMKFLLVVPPILSLLDQLVILLVLRWCVYYFISCRFAWDHIFSSFFFFFQLCDLMVLCFFIAFNNLIVCLGLKSPFLIVCVFVVFGFQNIWTAESTHQCFVSQKTQEKNK